MDKQNCIHEWKSSGLWDGRTPDGKPTGGQIYICQKCQDKAYGQVQVDKKGGNILQGFNIYGKPLNKAPNN